MVKDFLIVELFPMFCKSLWALALGKPLPRQGAPGTEPVFPPAGQPTGPATAPARGSLGEVRRREGEGAATEREGQSGRRLKEKDSNVKEAESLMAGPVLVGPR